MSGALDVFTIPSTDVSLQGYRMSDFDQKGSGIVPMEFKIDGVEEFVDLSRSYIKLELALDTPAATNKGIYADGQATAQATTNPDDAGHQVRVPRQQFRAQYHPSDERALQWDVAQPSDGHVRLQGLHRNPAQLQSQRRRDAVGPPRMEKLRERHTLPDSHGSGRRSTYECRVDHGHEQCLEGTGGSVQAEIHRDHDDTPSFGSVSHRTRVGPLVELKLELYFNSPEFFMFGTTSTAKKPVVLSADNIKGTFYLCRLTLNPSVYNELALRRKKQYKVAAYPTVRSELRSLSFEGNSTKFIEDNVFLGRVPDRLIVGLLDTRAFNGTLNYYPFAFQKFGVTSIKQIVRGEEYPYETLELNRNDELKDWHGYFRFLQATGPLVKHGDCMVKPSDWGHASNCTLFAWNNVPSGNADSKAMNPKQAGNVRLEINFGANPGQHLTILVWAEFENIMTIDPNGAVQYNIHDI